MIDLAVFDLETTGVDTKNDRIVTAYVGLLDKDGTVTRSREWIVDGDHYSEGAAAVHGWTKEKLAAIPNARRGPNAAEEVALEIAHLLHALASPIAAARPVPIAGHNVSYDLTMLAAHLGRSYTPMFPLGGADGSLVLDSIVLDKHFSKYVKGSGQRKLVPTAARYGIHLTEEQAHDASFDAIAAGRICQGIIARHAQSATTREGLVKLHDAQAVWRREQQASLEKWLRAPKPKGGGEPDAVCERGWPLQ